MIYQGLAAKIVSVHQSQISRKGKYKCCNTMHTYLGVSSFEICGGYFWLDMHITLKVTLPITQINSVVVFPPHP